MSSPKWNGDPEMPPDWLDLPTELTTAIAKRVTSIDDYISFRGVCSSWRLAATFDNFDREFPRLPWLMYVSRERVEQTIPDVAERTGAKSITGDDVSEKGEEVKAILGDDVAEKREEITIHGGDGVVAERSDGKRVRTTRFFDLESHTHRITNFPPPYMEAYLSWSGWLLYVTKGSVDVTLRHPIWHIKIELPGLNTFPEIDARESSNVVIKKMVMSSSPTMKKDLVVIVIWGAKRQLGFCRPGDKSWTVMATCDRTFFDIVYHNKRLYAVDDELRVVECDVDGPNPTQIHQVFVFPFLDHKLGFYRVVFYLVESRGKLLIVSRHFKDNHTTLSFRVFEIDLINGSHNEIRYLGNRALFLGANSSICIELPPSSKIKGNCVYFTNALGLSRLRSADVGCYRLSKLNIRPIFHGSFNATSFPTSWVVPSF